MPLDPAVLSNADARRLVEHFNEHYQEALDALAYRYGGTRVQRVRLTSVDEEGVMLQVGTGKERESLRMSFAERATGREAARQMLVRMLSDTTD